MPILLVNGKGGSGKGIISFMAGLVAPANP